MPTETTPSAPDEPMDAPAAQRTASEMGALVRVLFGVTTAHRAPAELAEPTVQPPAPLPQVAAPPQSSVPVPPVATAPVPPQVASIPVHTQLPVPAPAVSPPPATAAPAPLPMPAISVPEIHVPETPLADIPMPHTPAYSLELDPELVPEPDEIIVEPARESPRRSGGPSSELLQEIAFLDE